jgi:hypothetical protein
VMWTLIGIAWWGLMALVPLLYVLAARDDG